MTVRITDFGGTDWADGNVLLAADLLDSIREGLNRVGTSGTSDIMHSVNANLSSRVTTCNSFTVSGGATLTCTTEQKFIIVARSGIAINGLLTGNGAGGNGSSGATAPIASQTGLTSAGGTGGQGTGGTAGTNGGYSNFTGSSLSTGTFSTNFVNALSYSVFQPQFIHSWAVDHARFFGAGGVGGNGTTGNNGNGGNGGAGIILIAPRISVAGSITVNGANGTNGDTDTAGGGGGGGGGDIFLWAQNTLTLTSGVLTANGGNAGSGFNGGEAGKGGAGGFIMYNYGDLVGSATTSVLRGSGATLGTSGAVVGYSWINS